MWDAVWAMVVGCLGEAGGKEEGGEMLCGEKVY